MKIAVVSIGSFDTQYSDYHIMRDIILGLLERGHEVNLIQKQYLDMPQYPQQFDKYFGKQLQVNNIKFEKKAKADLKARYLADLSYYRQACKWMKKNKPDKVFLQSCNTAFFTVFYAKHILKCPLLYNEQDIFPENACFAGILSESSMIYKVAHALQKYAYKNATALSTISDDMKSTIVTRYGIPEDRVQVIYNWGHEELKAHSEQDNVFLRKYPKKPTWEGAELIAPAIKAALPKTHPGAKLLHRVEALTPEILDMAGGAGSWRGTGGMATKLSAARRAMDAGCDMVITNGKRTEDLYGIVEGADIGTRFIAKGKK